MALFLVDITVYTPVEFGEASGSKISSQPDLWELFVSPCMEGRQGRLKGCCEGAGAGHPQPCPHPHPHPPQVCGQWASPGSQGRMRRELLE